MSVNRLLEVSQPGQLSQISTFDEIWRNLTKSPISNCKTYFYHYFAVNQREHSAQLLRIFNICIIYTNQ